MITAEDRFSLRIFCKWIANINLIYLWKAYHSMQVDSAEHAILSTRLLCRPPSKSVCINISIIFSTRPSLTKRAGIQIILALLCLRASSVISSPQQIAALYMLMFIGSNRYPVSASAD